MEIVIAGASSLAHQLDQMCAAAGHQSRILDGEAPEQSQGVIPCDIAIEMENRSPEQKRARLIALSQHIPDESLLLSLANCSSVTQAASWVDRAQSVTGFGLVPPLSAPGAVEVAAGLQSSAQALERAGAFWRSLGFEPIQVADGPGLVRMRTICCLINEAASALMEGVASAADIDAAMRLGTNYPYGPLEWADLIGVDEAAAVMSALFAEWGEDRYRPTPLLKRMALAGHTGKEAGRGFYTYSADGRRLEE